MTTLDDAARGLPTGALDLARHAAVPVAVDARFLNLLRINFFLDPEVTLPYEAEAALLLSPVLREIGEGLYEIDPAWRTTLLGELVESFGHERLGRVAALLEQYTDRTTAWHELPELENAQRLTALSLLAPDTADEWLRRERVEASRAGSPLGESWFVAMERRLHDDRAALEPAARTPAPHAVVAVLTGSFNEAVAVAEAMDALLGDPRTMNLRTWTVGAVQGPRGPRQVVLAWPREDQRDEDAVVGDLLREFPGLRCVIMAGRIYSDVAAPLDVVVPTGILNDEHPPALVDGLNLALLASSTRVPSPWPGRTRSLQHGLIAGQRRPGPGDLPGRVMGVDMRAARVAAAAHRRGLSWFLVAGVDDDGPLGTGPTAERATKSATRYLLELLLRTETVNFVAPSPFSERLPRPSASLLVTVRATGSDRYTVSLQVDEPGRSPTMIEHLGDVRLHELQGIVTGMMQDVAPWSFTVELVVPNDLLNLPVESWAAQDDRSIGLEHPVVVRTEDPGSRPSARDRSARLGSPRAEVKFAPTPYDSSTWRSILHGENVVAAVLSRSPATKAGQGQLRIAVQTGIPAVLWDRRDAIDPVAAETLQRLVAGRLDALPERLRELRVAAAGSGDPDHPGHHLVLLWNDDTTPRPGPGATTGQTRLTRHDVTLAIVTTTLAESAAIEAVMGSTLQGPTAFNANTYRIGTLPSRQIHRGHVVALADRAFSRADRITADLVRDFPHLRVVITCGVSAIVQPYAGHPPRNSEILVRGGDVVVATQGLVELGLVGPQQHHLPSPQLVKADRLLREDPDGETEWLGLIENTGDQQPVRHHEFDPPEIHRVLVGGSDVKGRARTESRTQTEEDGAVHLLEEPLPISVDDLRRGQSWFMVLGSAHRGREELDQSVDYAALAAAAYVRVLLAHADPIDPVGDAGDPA